MKRIVTRKLPSGAVKSVQPFHISMKGLEKAILCRDNEDYGVMVKYIAICANRKDVIVIIYGVVSNHCHIAVLASDYQDAVNFAEELKRNYAQWFQTKYLEKRILRDTDVQAILLDSDWYVRNALAYIPRNAIDNGGTVDGYKWTGFRAMFSDHTQFEEFHEDFEIGLGIPGGGGVDHHGCAVIVVQDGLDVHFFQKLRGCGLVQLRIRVDEEGGGEIIRAPFGAGGAAVLDIERGSLGMDHLRNGFAGGLRRGRKAEAQQDGEKGQFHIGYLFGPKI